MTHKLTFILYSLLFTICTDNVQAREFDELFCDSTLRLDYVFGGNHEHSEIYLDDICKSEGWYGRRNNLDHLHLLGNGQLFMTDAETGDTIYCNSFTSLFLEWIATSESRTVSRSYEHPILVPMPRKKANVTMQLINMHQDVTARMTFTLDPNDILIRRIGNTTMPYHYIGERHDPRRAIDIAILPEGYTSAELDTYHRDCERAVEAILEHEPFASMKEHFNFVVVDVPSAESGNSLPRADRWRQTPCGSHFDTFYSERYNTTRRMRQVHELMNGIPYEHLLILTNTDIYGGGGFYNDYCIASAHAPYTLEVIVHEFGHSFGGLADEYATDNSSDSYYPTDREPWEKNITTLHDFASKWQDMLPAGTPVPTPARYSGYPTTSGEDADPNSPRYTRIGVYEGAGYQTQGVYRPVEDCRMRINQVKNFCPVCQRAITKLINYYVE